MCIRDSQKGFTRMYRGTTYAVNLLPKVKVETVVADDAAEEIISRVVKEITTGNYGDGKIFIYDVLDAVRIRTCLLYTSTPVPVQCKDNRKHRPLSRFSPRNLQENPQK